MKRENSLTCLTGALLGTLLSWGAAGCLITGFGLDVPQMGSLLSICALSAGFSALCFRYKWGGTALLCLLVPVCWLLFRRDQTLDQTLYMLHSILRRYDGAYGWGVPRFVTTYENPQSMLYPASMIGALVAVAVTRTVCRRKRAAAAVLAAAVPFGLCFVVTDTVPETGYLFAWMLGIVLLVLPNGVRRTSGIQGVRLTAMAAVPAALALMLLFWMVPREGYDKHPQQLQEQFVNWVQELPELWEDVTDEVASDLSGAVQPSEINLRTLGPRRQRVYPVMEVTAPESGTLYLRGQDYDVYDGTGWTATRHRSEDFTRDGVKKSSGNVTVETRRVRDVLYLPYYPGDGITLIGGKLDNSENLREYRFSQWLLPEDWRELIRKAETEPLGTEIHLTLSYEGPWDQRRYLMLPDSTRRWAVDLLQELLSDERTATSAADTIARYVKNSADYDLDTQRMPAGNEDFARWFLEESETGYCVHFATAATVLLRAAGIEARYVEGYMTAAPAGTAVTVTEDQAHAWAEYYEPILDSWIVLEATPADLTGDTPQTTPAIQESEQTQPFTEAEDAPATQPQGTWEPDTQLPDPVVDTEKKPDLSGLWKWIRGILALSLTVGAVLGQRRLRLWLRSRARQQGSPNSRALRAWRETELLYRLLKEPPPEEMEQLAQKAKYSRHSMTPEELERMDACIRAARQRLRDRPWYEQLIYQYVYAAY